VLPIVVDHVRGVLEKGDRAEITGEPDARLGGSGQALQERDRLGAGRLEVAPLGLEVSLAMIALASPRIRIEGGEGRPLRRDDQAEARLKEITLDLEEVRHDLLHRPAAIG